MNSFKASLLFSLLLLLGACTPAEPSLFESITPNESGITFKNTITSTPELNILNYIYFYNGAGVASADFNNDGLIDLYFTANQQADVLYLNKGSLQFQDITATAGIDNANGWTNGVAVADVNGDGWLDLYISKVGAYHQIQGTNLLYINQGINEQGIPSFKEQAKEYQLDFVGFSTQAAFFDYDQDGDLDLFLLNHSTNPNLNYGKGATRNIVNHESGDKLFENNNGVYTDVTELTGIFQSKIGYGLGVTVSDINKDGYPDLYVSNDFFENDYLYINQGNKTFREVISTEDNSIGHTTHYSMGNDISDLNNDGFPDIVSVDMLPENIETYKTSGTEFNYQIYNNYVKNGYAHQYMQNTLQLNQGNGSFSETGYLSGIAATEWSWSPLIADFDNDGYNDLFITNGILGATNDMDFINFIANDNIQKKLGSGMTEKEMAFIDKIPTKKTANYFFRNNNNEGFTNATETWFKNIPSFSNGATYADLDNDGDLDLVVNNVNETAFLLENKSEVIHPTQGSLKIQFKGSGKNTCGIGAKVIAYKGSQQWMKENFTTRGYLSSVAPEITMGLGAIEQLDSLVVIWPDGSFETKTAVPTKEVFLAQQKNASGTAYVYASNKNQQATFEILSNAISFQHKENSTIEFNRDPLLPFAIGHEGPRVSVADINNDGLDDLFIGGAKGQASALYVQGEAGSLTSLQPELFAEDAISEDVAQLFIDVNNDGFKDLIIVSGGNEFETGPAIRPRLYLNKNGSFEKNSEQFQDIFTNASSISATDFNKDGAMDVCITSNAVPQKFGDTPRQYLLKNDRQGNFTDVTEEIAPTWKVLGNVNNVQWIDLNEDGFDDAIVAGDWMPISIWMNNGKKLLLQENNGLSISSGFWNVVKAADFDGDGDLDLVAGNWGLNTRLKASEKEPITLYKKDFDNNHSEETLVTYYYQGKETTLASKEELAKQMPFINKKFLSYNDFAKASLSEVFGKDQLAEARQKKVTELGTCYFENLGNNRFEKHVLPFEAQVSSVNDLLIEDVDLNNHPDLLLVGNNFEISTQLGRLDALHGALLMNDGSGTFKASSKNKIALSGACRSIEKFVLNQEEIWIVTRNNNTPIFIKRTK